MGEAAPKEFKNYDITYKDYKVKDTLVKISNFRMIMEKGSECLIIKLEDIKSLEDNVKGLISKKYYLTIKFNNDKLVFSSNS